MEAVADEFDAFVRLVEPALRRALVAAYGTERGREATAEAFAYAWEHWSDVSVMTNPAGYLYRVGQSRTRVRRHRPVYEIRHADAPEIEPGLAAAVSALSERQRVAVVLVHGYGMTLREVADLTGARITTVQTHVERGLRHLRSSLGVDHDA